MGLVSALKKMRRESVWYRCRLLIQLLRVPAHCYVLPTLVAVVATSLDMLSLMLLQPLLAAFIKMKIEVDTSNFLIQQLVAFLSSLSISSPQQVLIVIASLFPLVLVAKTATTYLAGYLGLFYIGKVTAQLRNFLYSRQLDFGMTYFDRANLGHLKRVLMENPTMVAQNLQCVLVIIFAALNILACLLVLCYFSWELTLMVLAVLPLGAPLMVFMQRKVVKSSSVAIELDAKLSKKISDTLGCISTIKTTDNQEDELRDFETLSRDHAQRQFDVRRKAQLFGPVQEIAGFMGLLGIVIAEIFFFGTTGESVPNSSVLILFLVLTRRALGQISSIQVNRGSLTSMHGMIRELMVLGTDEGKFIVPSGKTPLHEIQKEIEFRDVCFGYSTERQVLKNINFTVEKGKTTAIVGVTGGGKSTLLKLVLRLYDIEPESIFIDGVDIRSYQTSTVRNNISYVDQDLQLFSGTLRKNILYGLKNEVSEIELERALSDSCLNILVRNLPNKLETQVGERGVQLSKGERQRVAIARALLKNAPILLLDEATSSLDSRTEQAVQKAVNNVVRNKTAIVVAHRLATIQNADKIVFVEHGSVKECGTLTELIQHGGDFAQLWESQKLREVG